MMLTILCAASAELYALALWVCYRQNRPETSDRYLYFAACLLVLAVKELIV